MKLDRLAMIANQLEGTIPMPENFTFDMGEVYSAIGIHRRGCILGLLAANFMPELENIIGENVVFLTTWEIIAETLVEPGETDDMVRASLMDLLRGDDTNNPAYQANRIREFLQSKGYSND